MQAKHKNTGRWEGVKPRLSHFQVYLTAKKCGPACCAAVQAITQVPLSLYLGPRLVNVVSLGAGGGGGGEGRYLVNGGAVRHALAVGRC